MGAAESSPLPSPVVKAVRELSDSSESLGSLLVLNDAKAERKDDDDDDDDERNSNNRRSSSGKELQELLGQVRRKSQNLLNDQNDRPQPEEEPLGQQENNQEKDSKDSKGSKEPEKMSKKDVKTVVKGIKSITTVLKTIESNSSKLKSHDPATMLEGLTSISAETFAGGAAVCDALKVLNITSGALSSLAVVLPILGATLGLISFICGTCAHNGSQSPDDILFKRIHDMFAKHQAAQVRTKNLQVRRRVSVLKADIRAMLQPGVSSRERIQSLSDKFREEVGDFIFKLEGIIQAAARGEDTTAPGFQCIQLLPAMVSNLETELETLEACPAFPREVLELGHEEIRRQVNDSLKESLRFLVEAPHDVESHHGCATIYKDFAASPQDTMTKLAQHAKILGLRMRGRFFCLQTTMLRGVKVSDTPIGAISNAIFLQESSDTGPASLFVAFPVDPDTPANALEQEVHIYAPATQRWLRSPANFLNSGICQADVKQLNRDCSDSKFKMRCVGDAWELLSDAAGKERQPFWWDGRILAFCVPGSFDTVMNNYYRTLSLKLKVVFQAQLE